MKDKPKRVPLGRPPIYTDKVLSKLANSLRDWVWYHSSKKEFMMLGDWCFDNNFNPKYFKRYTEKNQDFKEAYEWAKAWQEHVISKGALTQKVNARFAQFFLGCNHDWRSKETSDERLGVLQNDFGKFVEYMEEPGKIDKSPEISE